MTKMNENREREACGQVEGRRRVCSLTYHSSAPDHRHDLPRRSLNNTPVCSKLDLSVDEKLNSRCRLSGFDQARCELKKSDSYLESKTTETDLDEWKQIVDVLWSDPMPQNGCIPNEVRGGGCYWGPDVTEEVLRRNNLQLLIRSHECKQDGYEFCHNRRISDNSILDTMYKNHSNLETIFRIIDTDHSGLISFKEFHQTWELLRSHLKTEISAKAIADLAQSIDFNKDGSIDINEFLEAFRLVDISAHN